MTSLIDRLRDADGPDRELDAAIHMALFDPKPGWRWHFDNAELSQSLWARRSGYSSTHVDFPAYTASLDAVLALIGEVLPRVLIDLTEGKPGGGFPAYHSQLKFLPDRDGRARRVDAWGKSRSLSALIALLMAMEAQDG